MAASLQRTLGVLLRRTEYRDADLLILVFTRDFGKISALARGARRSQRRFGGALEPMHGLGLELSGPSSRYVIEGAQISQLRSRLTGNLQRMTAAARGIAWVRDTAPEGQADEDVWCTLVALLDALDADTVPEPNRLLAATGLQLLRALGWALELHCCVSCGRVCPTNKAAMLDPARGGLVCAACGGAKWVLSGADRTQLQELVATLHAEVSPAAADLGLRITDAVLQAHAGGA